MSKLFKSRHLPYRILAKILYSGEILKLSDLVGYGLLNVSDTAKALRCSNSRVIEALKHLEDLQYVNKYYITDKRPMKLYIEVNLPKVRELNEKSQ